ncbi:MAG: glycoside hydrolase family 25 protein [Lachnospiraceae bacterium]|nr:glycoside hydrolase family 25 protein [Lachnospiraceae bacterium]
MGNSMSKVKDEITEAEELIQDANDILSGKKKSGIIPEEPDESVGIGVDISKWNWAPYSGKDIDFEELSGAVDFVIIRCGYGLDDPSQDDAYFKRSVKACEENAIPYGVYLYSHATTKDMAKSEAKHTLRMIDEADAKPDLPVFLDVESSKQRKMSAAALTDIAKTYCSLIEAEGYHAGIYSSISLWNDKFDDPYFDQITKWVARYHSFCGYKKDYGMWQCSSAAKVSGIAGHVDYNYMVDDLFMLEDLSVSVEKSSVKATENKKQPVKSEKSKNNSKKVSSQKSIKGYQRVIRFFKRLLK